MVIKKAILITFGLILAFLIGGFFYFLIVIYQPVLPEAEIKLPEKLSQEEKAEKILNEWLPTILKTEFLPEKLNLTQGQKCPTFAEIEIEGEPESPYIFGTSWDIDNQKFYANWISAENPHYLRETLKVDIYLLEKIKLDEKKAAELFYQYFKGPEVNFRCVSPPSDL